MEKDFLINLKRIRTEKGISQKKMADTLGFAQNNYSKIERGLVELTVNRLYEIAEVLEVSILEILGKDEIAHSAALQQMKMVNIEMKNDMKKLEEYGDYLLTSCARLLNLINEKDNAKAENIFKEIKAEREENNKKWVVKI